MLFLFPTRRSARATIGVAVAGAALFGATGGAWVLTGQAHAQAAPIVIRAPVIVPVAQIQAPAPAPSPPPVAPAAPSAGALDCLAAAVYYEARGEPLAGQAAVAQVVLNRAHRPSFPKSVCGVVYQGAGGRDCQFSFACNGAMRRPREWAAWTRARDVAARALGGYVMAAIGQATSFHAARLGGGGRVVRVGGHVFFGGVGRPASPNVDRPVLAAEALPPSQSRVHYTFALGLLTPVPAQTRVVPPAVLIQAANPSPALASHAAS